MVKIWPLSIESTNLCRLEDHKRGVTDILKLYQMKMVHRETRDFGGSALRDDKPRTARILTKTDCHFAIVTKRDFKNCLSKFELKAE